MTQKTPIRTCLACRQTAPKRDLVRIVRAPEGVVSVDVGGRKAGRGAYVCLEEGCLKAARQGRRLSRALRIEIDEQTWEGLEHDLYAMLSHPGTRELS